MLPSEVRPPDRFMPFTRTKCQHFHNSLGSPTENKDFFRNLFLERAKVEKYPSGCLSNAPKQGPGPQARYVPTGIEPATLQFVGQCLTHRATSGLLAGREFT